jgi:hypothetical protein
MGSLPDGKFAEDHDAGSDTVSEPKAGHYEPMVSGNGFGELSATTRPAFPPKPQKPTSPIEDAVNYVANKWFQQLIPVRTCCYRCGITSPTVLIPHGTLAFGDTKIVRRHDRDITDDVISAFAAIRWKFQKHRAYCPECRDLGSV